MRLLTNAFILAVALIAADQMFLHGRYSSEVLDQATGYGTASSGK